MIGAGLAEATAGQASDWLMDHRKDFQRMVMEKLGKKDAEGVDWSAPRLICIAGDFNRYDDHAVEQIQRNIELIRYRRFGPELLMLDLVAATSVKGSPVTAGTTSSGEGVGATPGKYKTISTVIGGLDTAMIDGRSGNHALKPDDLECAMPLIKRSYEAS